jgi:predicted glutamine amidotransferase
MCKLFASTSLTPMDWPKVRQAVFTAMAQTEKDGLGAAWSTAEPAKFGRVRASGLETVNAGELAPFCEGFAKIEDRPYDGGPVICHGRTSTNFIGLANTHPFISKGKNGTVFALAHNGVVSSEKYNTRAGGCDTELILQAFISGGLPEVIKHISGYYALLILEKRKDRQLLHVIRDGMANLYCGKLGNAWAFATTPAILTASGATVATSFKRNTHAIFNGDRLVSCKQFTPAVYKYTPAFSASARKAFSGQQYQLEIEAAEEARLQAQLEKMETETADEREDFPLDERHSAHDWPAH